MAVLFWITYLSIGAVVAKEAGRNWSEKTIFLFLWLPIITVVSAVSLLQTAVFLVKRYLRS